MSITYKKLWKILIDKEMKKTDLKELAGVSSNVIAKLGKNEPVSIETLVKICLALGVDIGDVINIEQK
ncbi:helix-turn-helix domain-containing protein [Enterococcus casseliflavus]|uniref:XRE family transcriptional regulator n=1 Tax=Enterococcus faecium TaxID=1352 RepID=A0A7V7GQ79_ENTFC|nr:MULTISPECIES: helix-turn-helix transcriptional regulator [Enterococcus]EME5422403.1 helix-turn-helix transcriptional regulator [Enterococcus faecium]KAA0692239.1 XRE family transcriptional regulator [Enterococcus faecium]MBK5026601.1 helix-turn-helix transcriptional regulator [Enterococcus faecium]MBK5037771.1 helix-turn-helix transcriptional regulator [Enterococcus faecium]MBK5041730.1 helix-turn-helix transcriptional regulator [Enterococcus faecium]